MTPINKSGFGAANISRKIFGRGIGNHEILKGALRRCFIVLHEASESGRRPFRDEHQLQMVDDPIDDGMVGEEGDDRWALA